MATKQKERSESRVIETHNKTLWAHFAVIFLGIFLLFSTFTFQEHPLNLIISDRISALFLIVFGALSLSIKSRLSPWIVALTGVWLSFAPLWFWANEPSSYITDTLVGALAIAFSLLIPGIPGFIEESGHEIPPGWSYNPSSWIQRIPVIALAFMGWMISRILAAYQLGYTDTVWDPVFGDGTRLVITSKISQLLPVPDAGLGALAYTLEALLGCKGGEARWRTMPWLVVFFAFLVVPLGVVSILLVISQPLLVGAWCFLCLLAAFFMLLMVVLTIDEMVAVFTFLFLAHKEGQSLWHVFWKGGDVKGTKDDTRTPSFQESPLTLIKTWRYGISLPINLVLSAFLGVFLMLSPYLFSFSHHIADVSHLCGALIFVISVISFADLARKVRFLLFPIGIYLFSSSWFLHGHTRFSMLFFFFMALFLFLLFPYQRKSGSKYFK